MDYALCVAVGFLLGFFFGSEIENRMDRRAHPQ